MSEVDGERRRYPTWTRVALVALQVIGLALGLVLGTATYNAWSQPHEPTTTTTTSVVPVTPEPPDTLG
jgi:hypothetical protein